MKKVVFAVICVMVFVMALAGCSADDHGEADNEWTLANLTSGEMQARSAVDAPMAMPAEDWDDAVWDMPEAEYSIALGGDAGIAPVSAPAPGGMAEKIIYTVNAEIETVNFDESIAMVNTLMQSYGAFVENSSISGINHAAQFHGWQTFRSAWFTLRVPVQNLNAMSTSLDRIGNVTHLGNHATNITTQFIDTQSRLNSLTIQEERLLDMLRRAEDVPDLIAIEERLGDVRHQIESLTTTINNWQNQIDFSTITLNIWEVEQYTEQPLIHRSYWERIGDGFMATIRGIGNFFMNLFMWIIIAAPVLVILGAIAVATLLIVRWKIRSHKKNKAQTASTYTPPPPPTA